NAVQAAPLGVSTSTFAVVTANAGTVTTLALVKASAKAMLYSKFKIAGLVAGVLLVLASAGTLLMPKAPRFLPLSLEKVDGRPLAALRINYADGSTHTLFITYGIHTREWWNYPATEPVSSLADPNSSVVWTGHSSDGDRLGATHRMFKTSFDLPARQERVET